MVRGRPRGTRGRGRGTRGRRAARVISSDEEKETNVDEVQATTDMSSEQKQQQAAVEKMETDETTSAAVKSSEEKVEKKPSDGSESKEKLEHHETEEMRQTFDMEADISQLEPPTFTTISRGPPEPMLHLAWDHKVNLIGEKVLNPVIHCCEQCEKPILIYGRMIPCKHVFCLKCARSETNKVCFRCKEKAIRVEHANLGAVFMCTHGGTRYESKGCRRTYLSQRDLQAHINHRHINTPIIPRLESLAVKISEADQVKSGNSGLPAAVKRSDTRMSQERTPSRPNQGGSRSNSFSESGGERVPNSEASPGSLYYNSPHSSVITPTYGSSSMSQQHTFFSSYNMPPYQVSLLLPPVD